MARGNLQHSKNSRVWVIEGQAGPNHVPQYQSRARATTIAENFGGTTPVRIPDPQQYGKFLTVDTIRGQRALPTSSLEFLETMSLSDMKRIADAQCPLDIQLHKGLCKDPSDFALGWELIEVFEGVQIDSRNVTDQGALDQNQEAIVRATYAFTAQLYYQLKQLVFAEVAGAQVIQQIVDLAICDSRVCAECGIASDGCQRVFAVQISVGGSPGLGPQLTYSQDGGATWADQSVSSLAANKEASSVACVGPYLVVTSNTDDSIHYAKVVDILAGTPGWTKVTTGIAVAGKPNSLASAGRTKTWLVGDAGYIYFSSDITAGVSTQSAGDVVAQNLTCISLLDEENLLVGGALNSILFTNNAGKTWAAAVGPSGQAAVAVAAVAMISEQVWWAGYADGKLFYSIDAGANWTQKALPVQSTITGIDAISFSGPTVGYMTAHTATAGKILRTIDGGETWVICPESVGQSIPTNKQLYAVVACEDDPNVVYAGGAKTAGGDGIIIKGA